MPHPLWFVKSWDALQVQLFSQHTIYHLPASVAVGEPGGKFQMVQAGVVEGHLGWSRSLDWHVNLTLFEQIWRC